MGMDVSHFLARFLGSYMVIIAILWLIRKKQFGVTVRHVMGSDNTYSLIAILQIILGLLIFISHPVWTLDWRVIITLLGCFALNQGMVRLAFPVETKKHFLETVERGYWTLTSTYLVLGGILVYHGFTGG